MKQRSIYGLFLMQRSRTQARDFKETRENVWRSNSKPNEWQALDMHNADFEGYYQAQKIVPEGEWEAFMTSLRTMLPTTFRINGSGKFAEDLRNRLQTDFLSSFGSRPVQVANFTPSQPQSALCRMQSAVVPLRESELSAWLSTHARYEADHADHAMAHDHCVRRIWIQHTQMTHPRDAPGHARGSDTVDIRHTCPAMHVLQMQSTSNVAPCCIARHQMDQM
jgi:hypothetical protein